MSAEEKKKAIKGILKGYRRMTKAMEMELEALGIRVVRSKKHIKLYSNGKLYAAPSSSSDWRAGANLASVICRELC